MLTIFGLENLGLARAPCARSVGLGNRCLHGLGTRTLVLYVVNKMLAGMKIKKEGGDEPASQRGHTPESKRKKQAVN